jgi:hypothetical protein
MPRKPMEVVQVNLRIREQLRRRLEQEAKRRGVSLNYEMTSRLQETFDQNVLRTIDLVAEDIRIAWAPHAQANHDRGTQGDLLRAGETLLKQIDAENSSEALKAAADKLRKVFKMIDDEAVAALRRATTSGDDQ